MDFKVVYQPLALDDLEAIVRHVAEKIYEPRAGLEGRSSTSRKLSRNFPNAAAMFGAVPE